MASTRLNRSVVVPGGLALVAALAVLLSGCTSPERRLAPSDHPSSATTSPATTPATLSPGAELDQQRSLFDATNQATLSANPGAQGLDFIAGLEAQGFTRDTMQLTADITSIGLDAASIQFSVLVGDTCLIGQHSLSPDTYQSEVVPALKTGGCLIGKTVALD